MEAPRWIRQDRANAEVGGKLKSEAAANDPGIEARVNRLFRNDRNGDGRLERKEYDGRYFDQLDRNGNGVITRREATAILKRAN
ncbi:MAG: hypothetical protein F7O42_13040 [Opitutae bacterium]|nr:hypothetical protein [Opitutae bacterium]